MAALRNAAPGAFRVAGITNIAAADRHQHAATATVRSHYSAAQDDLLGPDPGLSEMYSDLIVRAAQRRQIW